MDENSCATGFEALNLSPSNVIEGGGSSTISTSDGDQEQISNTKRICNQSSPIFKLPNELLSAIILIAVGSDDKSHLLQLNIENVCWRWHHVARRNASLSNKVPLKRTTALVAESGDAPLNIVFTSSSYTSEMDDAFIELIGQYVHRWRTLELQGPQLANYGWKKFADRLVHPLPLLDTFNAPKFTTNSQIVHSLSNHAPKLRELRLSHLQIPDNSYSFPQLRVLEVVTWATDEPGISSTFALLNIVGSCSNLVELRLDKARQTKQPLNPAVPQGIIHLPSLQKIALGYGIDSKTRRAVFTSLRAPHLVSFEMYQGNVDIDIQDIISVYSHLPEEGIFGTVMRSIDSILLKGLPYGPVKIICDNQFLFAFMSSAHPFTLLSALAPMYLSNIRNIHLDNKAWHGSVSFRDFLPRLTRLESLIISRVDWEIHKIMQVLTSFKQDIGWNCPNLTKLEISQCIFYFDVLHSSLLTRYGVAGPAGGSNTLLPLQRLAIRRCDYRTKINGPTKKEVTSDIRDVAGNWCSLTID